jgi:hypothetical protein
VNSNVVSIIDFLANSKSGGGGSSTGGIINNVPYPKFSEGTPFFTILSDITDNTG